MERNSLKRSLDCDPAANDHNYDSWFEYGQNPHGTLGEAAASPSRQEQELSLDGWVGDPKVAASRFGDEPLHAHRVDCSVLYEPQDSTRHPSGLIGVSPIHVVSQWNQGPLEAQCGEHQRKNLTIYSRHWAVFGWSNGKSGQGTGIAYWSERFEADSNDTFGSVAVHFGAEWNAAGAHSCVLSLNLSGI